MSTPPVCSGRLLLRTLRCPMDYSLLTKMKKLLRAAGAGIRWTWPASSWPIKMHFGEPGNLAFLRPNFRPLRGGHDPRAGRPALPHGLQHALCGPPQACPGTSCRRPENGFSPLSTGCQMIIGGRPQGDGRCGSPRAPTGRSSQRARIGRTNMDARRLHLPQPLQGPQAYRLRRGHQERGHGLRQPRGEDGHAQLQQARGHGGKMPELRRLYALLRPAGHRLGRPAQGHIDQEACVGCGRCIGICNHDAIFSPIDAASDILNARMAEYAAAVLHDRPHFHISIANNISPCCDCHGGNDTAIVPDIGNLCLPRPRGAGPGLHRRRQRRAGHRLQPPRPVRAQPRRLLHRHPSRYPRRKPARTRRTHRSGHPPVHAAYHRA